MKTLIISFILTALSTALRAQDFEVPKNYELKTEADYTRYEPDVINAVNWIMKTPFNEQQAKRKDVSKFLLAWAIGSPSVSLEIKPKFVDYKQPELMIVFIGGWLKQALESKENANKITGTRAGLEAVMEYYQKNKKDLPIDKTIENFIKMKEKGTLNAYIQKNA